jgi:hypothetical protein
MKKPSNNHKSICIKNANVEKARAKTDGNYIAPQGKNISNLHQLFFLPIRRNSLNINGKKKF